MPSLAELMSSYTFARRVDDLVRAFARRVEDSVLAFARCD